MQKCEKIKARLSLYAHGELEGKQAERTAIHLERCSSCRAEVEAYRELAQRVRELPAPMMPEHALHGFARAIMEQIAPQPQRSRSRTFDFIASLFRPRWRYAWASVAMIALLLVLGIWYAPPERNSSRTLAPLLQGRAWDKIYYGLLQKESRALLMHEPVPAALLKTALAELLKQGERDQRVRVGVQRLLGAITGRASKRMGDFSSAKIMGVITPRGYIPARGARGREEDANVLLNELQTLPDNTEVTLAEIVNQKE